ncbi:HVO_0234 family beta-propeller protein [Halopiger goleimassiliensis]|uniref:HVO_0234 family beta-propeller protein n=1 Tax=Halopiger goleimassiliensis TaxID=1293048 RepID=UPI0006780BA3|nr:hypothetical protein [Halopiger goleimassiliensis]
MLTIEEKRVYGDRQGAIDAFVASSMGVVRVRVAGTTVGEFGLCARCRARDVAATADRVAVATDEDVRVLELPDGSGDADGEGSSGEPTFTETGFGPAVAVGYDGNDLLAADDGGRIACRAADAAEWSDLASDGVATVTAIDGDLVGTDSGVYRVHDGGLDHAGLTDVRDVAAGSVPLAATAEGLYKLGNGWMTIREGPFSVVAADPRSEPGRLTRAHAVSEDGTVYAANDDEWTPGFESNAEIVGIGYGGGVYAVTADGSFRSSDDGDPFATDANPRTRALGVTDVSGLAIPTRRRSD